MRFTVRHGPRAALTTATAPVALVARRPGSAPAAVSRVELLHAD